ncbi:hypothetical protein BDD12DRAFT_152212 [Trichophaea hybrida]|nr:hypothetical protein BDD12DRAFT_152212 [Trichophaea hybrida]
MSLPLSPPPSRSSSQASITRSNSESSCKPEEISPVSSAGSFASARMTKLSSTPSQAPQPHVKEVEDEDEGEAQGPRLQRRPSLASPTFGNTAASTAAGTPALRPSETEPWSATSTVPPFAPTPPAWQSTFSVSVPQTPTAPAPIPNARSDAVNSLLSYDAELLAVQTRLFQTRSIFPLSVSEDLSTLQTLLAENEKSFLSSLQTMYSITLSHLLQPNTAKEQRDRLMVQTQKAHLRRVGPAEVAALHRQLAAAEEEMSRLEQGILERRLERELEALEKRAKGELKIVERLRRRKEEWSGGGEGEG